MLFSNEKPIQNKWILFLMFLRNVFISSCKSVQLFRMASSSGKKLNGVKSQEVARVTRSSGVKRTSNKKIVEEEEEQEQVPFVSRSKATSSIKSVKRKLASPITESDSDPSVKEDSDDDFVEAKAPKRSNKKKKTTPPKAPAANLSKEEAEEKPKKNKKTSSSAAAGKAPKAELVVPDIKIPSKGEVVARPTGPSPYNGTIQFTNKVYLGAHISAAGGLENSITNAVKIGATCFALFLKSQRQWTAKPLEESTVVKFKAACEKHKILPHLILPHGSYLMNLGSSDPTILGKSRTVLLDEIQRCGRLGILYYNIHPGSTCGKCTREESIQSIADSINWVHNETPGSKVSIVLENMCRQGNTLGGDLAELASIISKTFDQSRVAVCIDTCHAFAAGYDLKSEKGLEKFVEEFEQIVGFRYLVAIHLNDSEGDLGCHLDRHAQIGKGKLGLDAFKRLINCERFRDIPLVLETPYINDETYAKEIVLLKSLAENSTTCA